MAVNPNGFGMLMALWCLLLLLHAPSSNAQIDYVNGGYWFHDSGITVPDIDSSLFTHLFCAFADLDTNTNQLSISSECATFTSIVRRKNHFVITLLSIGGGNVPSSDFNNMASRPESRRAFIDSSINVARANDYEGLDLDWEHQTNPTEMNNLATLLIEWRAALDAEARRTGKDRLILSAALGVTPQVNPQTKYPAQVIAKTLDWLNVMAYDMYAPDRSPSQTRSHALLRDPRGGISGSKGIQDWINAGVPANQLVLGFPYYGYAWKLTNPNNNGLLAPANGNDTSVGNGTPNYKQIRQFISQRGAQVMYDSSYVTNYCYSGTTWIGYDDKASIAAKVSYAKSNRLFGYFTWHVGGDDNGALSRLAKQTWDQSTNLHWVPKGQRFKDW